MQKLIVGKWKSQNNESFEHYTFSIILLHNNSGDDYM